MKFQIFTFFLLIFSISAIDPKLRQKVVDGVNKAGNLQKNGLLELAREDMAKGDFYNALKKIRLHQKDRPEDSTGFYLEAFLFARTHRKQEGLAALSKAKKLGENVNYTRLESMLKSIPEPEKNNSLSHALAQIVPVKENTKPPSEVPQNSLSYSYHALQKLRAIQSLIDQHTARKGEMEKFDWKAIQAQSVTTRTISIQDLGILTLDRGQIHSSLYGNVTNQQEFYKIYQEALQQKDIDKAIFMLESKATLALDEMQFLLSLYEKKQMNEKIYSARSELAEKFKDPESILWLARNAYEKGEKDLCIRYYETLIKIGSFRFLIEEAESRLKILKSGGSRRLQELLEAQKSTLKKKEI